MFGDNPIRRPVKGAGDVLEVQEIFTTIQGEGPYAGTPAVFIRLGGCNLACTFCDAEFESFAERSVRDCVDSIKEGALVNGKRVIDLIVITGGEPFRQPIEQLCSALLDEGFDVQVESNGTLYRDIDKRVTIVCSPKNTGAGYLPIRDDVLGQAIAIKFVVSAYVKEYAQIAEVGQTAHNIPVYIQPMDEHDDEKNEQNMHYARKLAMQTGHRMSIQLHKVMEVA